MLPQMSHTSHSCGARVDDHSVRERAHRGPDSGSVSPRGGLADVYDSTAHTGEQASQRLHQSSALHISLSLGPAREVVAAIS